MGLFRICSELESLSELAMKLNVAFPATGCQKLFEINDEHKVRPFYEKRMGQDVDASCLGDEWKGYMLRITGGNDKQGFPMKQGVLTQGRVRLLLKKGHSCFRERRAGQKKRKSVRGCIVDANLSVLSMIIVKKGETEIPGLTDDTKPRRLGHQEGVQDQEAFHAVEGGRCAPVRHQAAASRQGGQGEKAAIQGAQDSAPRHPRYAAEEAPQAGAEASPRPTPPQEG